MALLALFATSFTSARGWAQSAPESRPALRGAALDGDVRVDGHLDEAVWAVADSIDGLTQTEPVQGGTPTGRTVVKVLANGGDIVIGIRANTRLRWTFHPLGDLFVVYNHNVDEQQDRWTFASSQLLLKLQYTMRY